MFQGEFSLTLVLPETDISEIVFIIKLLEIVHYILIGLLLEPYAAELCINYEDDTSLHYVVVAQILVDSR